MKDETKVKIGRASKSKGKRGERELARKLSEYGYHCRRTQQYNGKSSNVADVIGLVGIHIECKRVEKLNICEAIEQAKRDCLADELPTVFHRRNNHEWLVTLPIDGFMKLYQSYSADQELTKGSK